MRRRLLTSGRVRYLPMSEVTADGTVISLLSGGSTTVTAGQRVDATHSNMAIPATHPPRYAPRRGDRLHPTERSAAPRSRHSALRRDRRRQDRSRRLRLAARERSTPGAHHLDRAARPVDDQSGRRPTRQRVPRTRRPEPRRPGPRPSRNPDRSTRSSCGSKHSGS